MISKLFRFQFKELSRFLFPVMGISAVLMLLAMIPTLLLGISFINQLVFSLMYIILVGSSVVMILLMIIRDYHNFYGKRAYLTHSFPASAKELFLSRILYYLLSNLCITLYTFLQTYFLYRTVIYPKISPIDLQQVYQYVKPLLGWFILYGISATFLSVFMGMAINTLGAGRKLQRFGVGGPLLIYLLLSTITQIFTILATIFFPLSLKITIANTSLSYSLVKQNMFSFYSKNFFDNQHASTDLLIGIGNLLVFIVMGIILALIVNHHMKKRVCLK